MKKFLFFIIFNSVASSINLYSQWVQMSNGISSTADVCSLAGNGNYLFAGTAQPPIGVYLSTDNGTSWIQTSFKDSEWANSIAVNGNNIFVGTEGSGVYLSTNNGTNWTQTSLNNQPVITLAINGNNVFAGTPFNGVYVSTNNGTNWTQTILNN